VDRIVRGERVGTIVSTDGVLARPNTGEEVAPKL
jgi:hypothetical protein